MDMQTVVSYVAENLTPVNVVLLVLLLTSEILGNVQSVKSSSVYEVVKLVLKTVAEKVFSKPAA